MYVPPFQTRVLSLLVRSWCVSLFIPFVLPVSYSSISKKKPACTCTYYALMCLTGTCKAFVRKFSVRSVSYVNILQ
jgi:hypothetical protein